MEARRTLPPAAAPDDDSPAPDRDPFLVSLPRDEHAALLVLEANALRHSRVGELFVDCIFRSPDRDLFEEIRRELGVDPLVDLDRVALAPGGTVLSGFFQDARLGELERDSVVERRGAAGRIYRPRSGSGEELVLGAWGEHLLAFGTPRFVEQTIDRLEGRAPDAPQVIPESLAYGEAYGVVPGDGLRALFRGEGSQELGLRLAEVASRIELHADAMNDVAIVARVSGPDPSAVQELGKAFGAALAVGRLQARARGDERFAQLLEHARVVQRGDGFSLELALPVDVLEGWFAGCGGGRDEAGARTPP
jgi:hypothetical protein